MTTTTADLQITRFHNCSRCIGKVKRALGRLDGVELLDMDPENGKFTIRATRHPEEIRGALQRRFAGNSVLLSNIINHPNPPSALINPHNSPIQGPLNYHDTEAVVAVARANGAQSVELRQSNTFIFTFDNQATTSGTATNAPPPVPPSSAPPQQLEVRPTTFGSTWADENVGDRNGGFGYDYVNPPSQQTITSGSARADVYGGARYEDFGHGSTPLIRTAQTRGYVYAHPYPVELYRDDDCLRCGACCAIL